MTEPPNTHPVNPPNIHPVNPPSFQLVVGIDRSDERLDYCGRSGDGTRSFGTVPTAPESLHGWMEQLLERYPEPGAIAVAFEQPSAGLLAFLAGYRDEITIYALNPAQPAKFRETFVLSHCKDDPTDADYIAELVALHAERLTPWEPQSEACRLIEALGIARRKAVDDRTRVTNQLRQTLKNVYPQALELLDDIWRPVATAFLKKWPVLQDAQRARPETLRKFYYANRVRRADTVTKRIERIARAKPLTEDPAVIESGRLQIKLYAKMVELLTRSIADYDGQLAAAFAAHPDRAIYESLPFAAEALAPRLLAAMGDNRGQMENANQLQCRTGIAPARVKSGKTVHRIQHRFICSKFVRQTFMEWAGLTIQAGGWARAYYDGQRERGSKHHKAVRALAYKWQRILFRCWTDRVPYDEKTHRANLKRLGSPLVERIEQLEKQAA